LREHARSEERTRTKCESHEVADERVDEDVDSSSAEDISEDVVWSEEPIETSSSGQRVDQK
jgi:hypothetical protein